MFKNTKVVLTLFKLFIWGDNITTGKSDRRVKYTKMILKKSITELLTEKPIEKITVKEICERADVNRGTFYSHYSDQFDLYNSIVGELIEGVFERLGDFLYSGRHDLLKSVALVYEYIKENSTLVGVLLQSNTGYSLDTQLCDIIEKVYLRNIKNNMSDDSIVDAAYSFMASGNIGLIKYWLNTGMQKSVEEMASLSVRISTAGLSAISPNISPILTF